MSRSLSKVLQGILNLLSVNTGQHRTTHHLLREIKQTMSAETDQLQSVMDNIQTTITNAMAHQELSFSDLEAKITNTQMSDSDKQAILAITARAKGFNTDLQNMDAAAVAADPGPAVVTLPGTPDPVTPTTPPDPSSGSSSSSAPSSPPPPPPAPASDGGAIPGTSATGAIPPGAISSAPAATDGSAATTAPQPGTGTTPNDVAQNAPEATLAPAPLNQDGTVVGSDQQTANPLGVNPGGTAAQGGTAVSGGGSANPNELNNADPTTGNADRTPAMPNPDGSQGAPLIKSEDLASAGTQPGDAPSVVTGS